MIRSPAGYDGDIRIKRYLDYYQASYGVMMLSAGQVAFSPIDLFASGAPGVWYDSSDLSTMYQDAAGTTPVTAVEQPVGLRLDKSRGLVLGSELVTNGTFDSATGWTTFGTGASIASGVLTINNAGVSGGALQGTTMASGKSYRVTANVTVRSGIGRLVLGSYSLGVSTATFSASGVYSWTLQSLGPNVIFERHGGTPDFDIDNVSVKELPGSHAYQTIAINRPVLSARYNLLTRTEEFDNAAWVKTNLSFSGSKMIPSAVSGTHGVTQDVADITDRKLYVEAKADGYSLLAIGSGLSTGPTVTVDLSTGLVARSTGAGVLSSSVTAMDDGYYAISVTISQASRYDYALWITQPGGTGDPSVAWTGDGTSGILIRKPDHRAPNDGVGLPAYQRVTTATDYDTTGFPYYLRYNGTNSTMQTASIDFSSTDKLAVFAGVRKLSDAAQWIAELSSSVSSNNGAFLLNNWSDAKFYFGSKGTTYVEAGSAAQVAPLTAVIVGASNISGPSIVLRQNGAQVGTNTSSQGTGNYGNYPLYIGARSGSTFWFNGRDYGLIVLGRTATATEIASTEAWLNGKTKAYA